MARMSSSDAALCRHMVDTGALESLKELLRRLPEKAPDLLQGAAVPEEDYEDLLKMAVESMRGTQSATMV